MTCSASSLKTRATSSLSSGLPGTIASLPTADVAVVEPELGLAAVLVGPVAGVAILREDRPDVAVELDPGPLARVRRLRSRQEPISPASAMTAQADGAEGSCRNRLTLDRAIDTAGFSPTDEPHAPLARGPAGRIIRVFNTSFTIPDQAANVTLPRKVAHAGHLPIGHCS